MSGTAAAPAHGRFVDHLRADLRRIRLLGGESGRPWASAVAVVAAVLLALSLHMQDPWWAGISAWVCMQPSAHASLVRAAWRMTASIAGAALGCVAIALLADQHLAMHVFLFVLGVVAHRQQLTSRYSYAWLLSSVTALIVIYSGLGNPASTFEVAWFRAVEVALGVAVAAVMAVLLLPERSAPPPDPVPPPEEALLRSSLTTGLTLSVLPALWSTFDLPALATVFSSVVLLMQPARDAMRWKALNRFLGCLIGGALGILLLGLVNGAFVPWLLGFLLALVAVAHVHLGGSPVAYAGTQAGFGLIVAMVQGQGPSDTMAPALDRLFGIGAGLLVLEVMSVLVDEAAWRLRRARLRRR